MVLVGACTALWWDVEQGNRQAEARRSRWSRTRRPASGLRPAIPEGDRLPQPGLKDEMVPSATRPVDDYPFFPGCEQQMTNRPLRPCQFGAVKDQSVPHVAVIGDSHVRALMPALVELAKKRVLSIDLFTSGGLRLGGSVARASPTRGCATRAPA